MYSKVKLRDGNEIPLLGFGTYEMEGQQAYRAVSAALQAGYRHIDSAAWYYNEREVGKAILDFCSKTGTPRTEIFFTTKLRSNNGFEETLKSIQTSIDACGLGYIDLYLIHSPIGGPSARMESWKAILEAKKGGNLKSIGVSNYGAKHLQELIDAGCELPVINQVDLHPFMTRTGIVRLCRTHDIALEAWAPLVRGLRFDNSKIKGLASKYDKEPSQVLIRYSIQKGFIPIPKSSLKSRIIANTRVFDFELSPTEIQELDKLDEYLITDWDPTGCP